MQPRMNFGHGGTATCGGILLRQQPPQLRMMPAQRMPGTVAVRPDAGAQSLHLGDERLAAEGVEILVHGSLAWLRGDRCQAKTPFQAFWFEG